MDPTLTLTLDRSPAAYRPGERLDGRASWQHVANIRTATVRLFWTTTGKGTTDTTIVLEQALDHPQPDDARSFAFDLPTGPPGFSGALITLSWGVELVIDPGGLASHCEFVFGPQGEEIRLPECTPDPARKKRWWKTN